MAYEFKVVRSVEFYETDMAGIVHYSNFFRYMEVAEAAFFRSLGLSILAKNLEAKVGWPRHELVTLAGLLAEGNTCHPTTLYFYGNDAEIVEDSPTDSYWGAGAHGGGRNRLGQILMSVRDELRRQEAGA